MKSIFSFVLFDNKKLIDIDIRKPNIEFSDGTIQCNFNKDKYNYIKQADEIHVVAHMKDNDGIFALTQYKSIIDSFKNIKTAKLFMPYIPYARYDRAMFQHDAFSLKLFTNILNILKFDEIVVHDPHSEISNALIDNLTIVYQHECFKDVMDAYNTKFDVIVSPDIGAMKKASKIAMMTNKPIIMSNKVRDVTTGHILLTEVFGDVEGKICMIPDDICDGGATFILLAQELKKRGATEVYLYVTHGIFSKTGKPVKEHINKIFAYYLWAVDKDINTLNYF